MSTESPHRKLLCYLLTEAGDCVAGGRYSQALMLLAKGFAVEPEGTPFQPLTDLCRLMERWDDLEQFCHQRALSVPQDPFPWYHLAAVALHRCRFLEAIRFLGETLRRDLSHTEAWIELGNTWKQLGELPRAIVCYRRATQLMPENIRAVDNLLFASLFSDRYTPAEMHRIHQEWGKRYNTAASVTYAATPEDARIRVGYLSPDLREHSVSCFLEPVLSRHDRQRFEVFCYQCNRDEDAVTLRLRGYTDAWRNIADCTDEEAAHVIRQDNIHILVDLAGHTAGNRLPLLALHPALVQVTWLGYPHSTGLEAIECRISDAVTDPPGHTEWWHTEKLVRLPAPFLCYQPPCNAPAVVVLSPCSQRNQVTFACFNRIDKISPTTLSLWRSILEQLPTARLLLKSEVFADPDAAEHFITRSGLPKKQLELLVRTPDRGSHLALCNQVDIALDSFPYNGTTTTCEALWMGLPVVTLAGQHHAARVGKVLLETVGLGDLVAESGEEYVQLAVDLAGDHTRRTILRQELRETVASSALCDGEYFTRQLEMAYSAMLPSFSV